jgi:hypothetical protein
MKKILIIILSFHIAAHGVSQGMADVENGYNKIRIGVKAGIVFTRFKTQPEPGSTYSNLLRLRTSLFAHIPISSKAYFRPEIALAGKGTKYETSYLTRDLLSYVEVPLNVLYKAASSKGIFLIGGGPAPAFLINNESYRFYASNNIKKFDLGINALATYESPLGFSFNIQYTYGLLNISRDKSGQPTIKNRCFGIFLGYLF